MKYIGKCIYERQNDWRKYLGSGVYLKRAIKKYGRENFSRKILYEANSEDELNRLEELVIEETNAVESSDYYNLKKTSIGGDIFTYHPDKERIREMRRKQMSGTSNHQYGKPKSKNMIESVKIANSKPIEIDGIRYPSLTAASERLGIKTSTIHYRLNHDTYPNYKRIV